MLLTFFSSMLKSLFVNNYVLIEQLDLDFGNGFHVFTGETGAGKSIMVGALSLLLGSRADFSVIRDGHEKCEISALFDISDNQEAQKWLQSQDLDASDEVELRRVIHKSGKSKSWINSRPFANASIKEFGGFLVQIHGQHDQIKINQARHQLQIIDDSGDYSDSLAKLSKLAQSHKQICEKITQLNLAGALSESESQLLQYQFEELEQLQLTAHELDELHQQQKSLTHAVDSIQSLESSLQILSGESSENPANISQNIAVVMQNLTALSAIKTDNSLKMLEEVEILLNEVENDLNSQLEHIEVNPERLSEIESRLNQIYETARKHKVNAEHLYSHYTDLGQRLQLNESQSQELAQLQDKKNQVEAKYNQLAQDVSQLRTQHADIFSQKVTQITNTLGLDKADFKAVVEFDENTKISEKGKDTVSFEVKMNPGQSAQKIAKTASGGELSRIALAIEICKSQGASSISYVFDEVDSGIGGAVAETVGKLMRQLSQTQQVFAVTHLPQVAGLAHQHFFVSKLVSEQADKQQSTLSNVQELSEMQRIQELARMLGGSEITETTLLQAKAFLQVQ